MNISILCTVPNHPVVEYLVMWKKTMEESGHTTKIHHDKDELSGGDLLFLVSCGQIIGVEQRNLYAATLVLHASDLPSGRGWSPHIWSILEGQNRIVVSLLEAADSIDSGDIWLKKEFILQGNELLPEINRVLFQTELDLMSEAVSRFKDIEPRKQSGDPGPYLRLRTPSDSELDPMLSIGDQFNLLRVVDSERYPAYFVFKGKRYILKVEEA